MRLGTSLRARTAGDTAARCRRLAERLGIARVSDISALDTLGLPVFISLRPKGRSARLHAGKGLSATDAETGALMEAFECAVAERAAARGPTMRLRLGDLAARLPDGLALADFAPLLGAVLDDERPTPAVRCDDLMSRRRLLLPAELVMVPAPDEGERPPLFGWSTNGLASGNTLQEATLHALLEVLERDTAAMSAVRDSAMPVDLHTLPAAFIERIARWQALGVQLFVRRLEGDFGLPCFDATLYEPGQPRAELARGWGIHFDREVALARAVSEAAQSRLCLIHSGDADAAPFYGTRIRIDGAEAAQARQSFRAELGREAATPGLDFRALPHVAHTGIRAALRDLLARLRARGFDHVFRYRMHADEAAQAGLHVVKVIVPRCETPLGERRRAGPRLRAEALTRRRAA